MAATAGPAAIGERASAAASAVLDHITAATPVPSAGWLLVASLLGAALLVAAPAPAGRLVTVAHEGGHAFAAVLTRRRVLQVRVHADGSGETRHYGRPGSLGSTMTAFAGYPFPGLLGAALIAASASGTARLWAAPAALGLLVLLLRTGNLHGWLVVGGAGAGLVLALWFLPTGPFALLLAGLGSLLLVGAIRSLLSERRLRLAGERGTDVAVLARGGSLAAAAWWTVMMATVLGSAWLAWGYLSERVPGL